MKDIDVDEVVVLLGAGASVDAGIPHSKEMIEKIERKFITGDVGWRDFERLYNYVQSAIYFSEGIKQRFSANINYNIETLIDTLSEIIGINQHTLYPFVESWSPRLTEFAGNDYALARVFREKIVDALRKDWLTVRNYDSDAQYYSGLLEFRNGLQTHLRVFTLNYDLCLERICAARKVKVQRGFDAQRCWTWHEFDENRNSQDALYLYKLHGSMDWAYGNDGTLTFHDDPSAIGEAAIIFGSTYKLEYQDPFLFFVYEFRRWTLESRIVLVIGYGFGDEHINKILLQALRSDRERLLLVVSPMSGELEKDRRSVADSLGCSDIEQIHVKSATASEFFQEQLSVDLVKMYLERYGEQSPF